MHVQHVRNGKIVYAGTGSSFWFRPLSAVLSEMPVGDRELPLLFHARTADFQDVTVQATLTYRLTDQSLTISVESDHLVAFGDGIEADKISLTSGQRVSIGRSERTLRLVR